jgi:hypothetical protein
MKAISPFALMGGIVCLTLYIQYVDRDGQMARAFRQAGNAYKIQWKSQETIKRREIRAVSQMYHHRHQHILGVGKSLVITGKNVSLLNDKG